MWSFDKVIIDLFFYFIINKIVLHKHTIFSKEALYWYLKQQILPHTKHSSSPVATFPLKDVFF